MALSHQQRDQIERRIRAAIDRLLDGQIPPGGACDVKTLAREAGVSRASLYRTWGHLKDDLKEHHRLLLSVLAAKDDELQRFRRELSTFSRTFPARVPDQGEGTAQGRSPRHRH
ncbi:hypothetical protein [Streptomyces caelestis]|uniref:hypothetical protein n=1 Tax=Streptomyces caelestis TaxID=36816 RepID=UPI0036516A46